MKMKLLLPTLVVFIAVSFIAVAPASAKMGYTCYRHLDGKPTGGFVKVSADNKQEATRLAQAKYDKLKLKYDSVNCK